MKLLNCLILCLSLNVYSTDTELIDNSISDDQLFQMSIEELISFEITSVARKKQRLIDSAAAIYVITSEDISRSGARSIPDLLRMVPGLQVAQMNASSWSISVRGFNYIFANKLLVMMDGRTLYTPLFSGVNWDVQDTILQDIDRIEVIRGPGAAMWGANAVNGVINIISKSAEDTQSKLISIGGGNQEKYDTSFRVGGKINQNWFYRLSFKSFFKNALNNKESDSSEDDWKMDRIGFWLEGNTSKKEKLTVSGALYKGKTQPPLKLFNLNNNQLERVQGISREQEGGHLIGQFEIKANKDTRFSIKTYFDYYFNDDYRVRTERKTTDIELEFQQAWLKSQELIMGMGYRTSQYQLKAMNYAQVKERAPLEELTSFFIQNESKINEKLNFTLSSRLEDTSSTGIEFQPNIRMQYAMSPFISFWVSLSRAVRTPAITERLATIPLLYDEQLAEQFALMGQSAVMRLLSKPTMQAEKLDNFELGYRQQINKQLAVEITGFKSQYKNLIGIAGASECPPQTASIEVNQMNICAAGTIMIVPAQLNNSLNADTQGIEINFNWQLKDNWKIEADYAYLDVKANAYEDSFFGKKMEQVISGLSAEHTANIRNIFDINDQWRFNFWLRHMGENKNAAVDSYWDLDLNLSYSVNDTFQLNLIGNNLLSDNKLEFNESFTGLAESYIKPSWFINLTLSF